MTSIAFSPHVEASPATALCRFCGSGLRRTFIDLGMSPLCETYPNAAELNQGEMYYPLHAYVCEECWLVQLEQYEHPQSIFGNYPYFASFSESWLRHCEKYCGEIIARLGLTAQSFVTEVASNDGYLLQYFVRQGIPVLGIEPAANVAAAAIAKRVPTLVRFFGTAVSNEVIAERGCADLVIGNNVLAQVPDLNDFVEGLRVLLKPDGVLTLEFPHLLRLIERNEFDTIYHEHFSYFSLCSTVRLLKAHGLRVFDVEELKSHGGSLRVFASSVDSTKHALTWRVGKVLEDECAAALNRPEGYEKFAALVKSTKLDFVDFLVTAAREGKSVVGYGAPGKSATLLHYCGIGKDLIQYTVDRSVYKQGRHLPGTHIPIFHPDRIAETKPDYVVILPWNLKEELTHQLQYIREWGGRFVTPIPKLDVY